MPSKVPAAIDGLLALVTALQATTLAGVDIFDGPKLTDSQTGKRLFVGYDIEGIAAHGAQDWASIPAASKSRGENMTIRCVAESMSGQTDMKGRRDEAFAIVAAVEGAIKGDPTLGGAVTYANCLAEVEVRQPQTPQGAVCTVFFGVAYYARFA